MKINFSALKAKVFPMGTESKNDFLFKDMSILDYIEKIIEISQKYDIDKCLSLGKDYLDFIARKLGISPLQAALFSHFMEKSTDNRIEIGEIAESIKCSKLRVIKYTNDCEELEKKKLIRIRRDDNNVTYRVPRDVCESIRKYNEFRPVKKENLSIEEFFYFLEQIFDERANGELTCEAMGLELQDLINQNMHLIFCKKIMSYNIDDDDLPLLVCFCHLSGNNNDDNIGDHDLRFLYDNHSEYNRIKKELSDGSHWLFSCKFISPNNSDGFVNSESWRLSDNSKKELLSELNIKGNQSYKKDLILYDTLKPKKMFYNAKEEGEIQNLASLLSEDNYCKILERLEGKGMRKGFACLFSGGPGTGKTETAWQIALETKRNIMMVDISETKSMWYGESEKKIKEIFDSYRTAVGNSEIAPILLFNEADAVIGRRKEFGSASRAIDQTENTIQNIILQEMENLSGILIATTNLTQNMDSAFERRFLYKITFEKPNVECRKGIWNTMLPDLSEDTILELSGKFELSGGQIENIARKIEVDGIINGSSLCKDKLLQYCKDEVDNGFTVSKKIGFGN